jgi:hypothetical protein
MPDGSHYNASEKKFMPPAAAAAWFLHDMAEVAGYPVTDWAAGGLSPYARYRPVLTASDPWYLAGVVALEACKICDLFPTEEARELMREVVDRLDGVAGRDDDAVSALALLVMGRLGMGSLLMHRKVPDNLLAKVMLILLGSPSAAAPLMPSETAHEQIRAALKLGPPVWWMMFNRRYVMTNKTEAPRLVPSSFANNIDEAEAA